MNRRTLALAAVAVVVFSGSIVLAQNMDLPPVSKGGELAYVRDYPTNGLETATAGERLQGTYVSFTLDEHPQNDLLIDFASRGRIADTHVLHRADVPAGTFDGLSWVAVDHVERGILFAEGPNSCFAALNGVNAGTALYATAPGSARYLVLNEFRMEQVDDQTIDANRDGHTYRFQLLGDGALSLDGQNVRASLEPGDQLRGWITDEYPATTKVMHASFDDLAAECSVPASAPGPEPEDNGTSDVAVDKEVASQDNETVTFAVTVTSVGDTPAEQVTMMDELPAVSGAWFLAGPDSEACSLDDGTLACAFGTLAPGEDRSVSVRGYVRDLCGPLENTATASASGDADAENDSDTAVADLPPCDQGGPDVAAHKEVAAQDNETVTFAVSAGSVGDADATNVTLHDDLPAVEGDWFLGGTDADACTLENNTLECAFGSLAPGEDRSVSVRGYVRGLCGPLENTATVGADEDANATNDASTAVADLGDCPEPEPEDADIDVNKTVSAQDDETVTFLVTLFNHGPAVAVGDGVYLNDTLPPVEGDWFLGGTDAEACHMMNNSVSCHWEEVPAGEERSFTVRGYVRGLCGPLENTATGWAENDVTPDNNRDTATARLAPCDEDGGGGAGSGDGEEEDEQESVERRTQGYWKNHPDAWPVDELTLGGETYTREEALDLFATPPKGDASLILAHQLMAAKLNVANGADGGTIQATIDDADAALSEGGRLPQGVHASTEEGQDMTALADDLDAWNNGDEDGKDLSTQALVTEFLTPSLAVGVLAAGLAVAVAFQVVRRR